MYQSLMLIRRYACMNHFTICDNVVIKREDRMKHIMNENYRYEDDQDIKHDDIVR